MSQQTQKRPSSPLPVSQGVKKRIVVHGGQNGKLTEGNKETFHAMLQKLIAREVELVEQGVFKDHDCQRLKKKFDEIDRNCRRWHEYALGLQNRVKRLAVILHRQKDSLKSLKDKGTSTAEIGVQTDFDSDSSSISLKHTTEAVESMKEPPKNTIVKPKKEMLEKKESSGSKIKPDPHNSPVVIDLTDEEKKKDPSEKFVQGRQLTNGLHNNLPVVTKPVNSPTRYMSRQENIASAKTKSVIQKVPPYNNSRANVLQQNSGQNVLSPSKTAGNCSSPYPPLPPNPVALNLPKSDVPGPPQPVLRIRKSDDGMELSWNHASCAGQVEMESYELFVYQHNPSNNASNRWKKIGSKPIEAMALPMACTLSQFSSSSKYYFAVRGKDKRGNYSDFSSPCCSSSVHK